jgi:hypothetical protein
MWTWVVRTLSACTVQQRCSATSIIVLVITCRRGPSRVIGGVFSEATVEGLAVRVRRHGRRAGYVVRGIDRAAFVAINEFQRIAEQGKAMIGPPNKRDTQNQDGR